MKIIIVSVQRLHRILVLCVKTRDVTVFEERLVIDHPALAVLPVEFVLHVMLQEYIRVHQLLAKLCIGQYVPDNRIILPVLCILVIDL